MFKHFKPLAAALCAAAILTATTAHAGDDWTPAQQGKGVALATLVAINWAQEHSRARDATDTSPPVGRIPGQPDRAYAAGYSGPANLHVRQAAESGDIGRVNRQFLLGSLAGALILDALPSEYRDKALNAGLVLEVGVVANNLRLGVGFRF